MRLKIRPLSKVLYRGPGEFDMSSRGVYSTARSMIYPLPTSVSSILSYYKANKYGQVTVVGGSVNDYWLREYISIMKSLTISGPLISIKETYYLLYDLKSLGLIKIGSLEKPIELHVKTINLGWNRLPGAVYTGGDSKVEYIEIFPENDFLEFIGVKLMTRRKDNPTKEVEGAETDVGRSLYSVTFFDPNKIAYDLSREVATISYDYYLYNDDSVYGVDGLYRFGGEGSTAYIALDDEDIPIELFNLDSGWIGLYMASPLLVKTGMDYGKLIVYVGSFIKESGIDYDEIYMVGESILLGAGISSRLVLNGKIMHLSRRPIYEAYKPGSIIYFRSKNIDSHTLKNLFVSGIGYASQLGFGTVIPFKPIFS